MTGPHGAQDSYRYYIHSSMARRSIALAPKKVAWKNHSFRDRRPLVSRESFLDSSFYAKRYKFALVRKPENGGAFPSPASPSPLPHHIDSGSI